MMPTGDEPPLQPTGRPAPWTVEAPTWPPSVAQLAEPLPDEDAAAPEQPRRRVPKVPWRRFAVAGLVLIAVGLLSGGFVVGWVTHAALGSTDGDTTVEVVQAPDDADARDTALPDVRGLAVVDARQAIADVGLEATSIKAVDAPSALAEGTVVGQDPIGGTTGAGAVTLFVAVPGKVPDLVGRPSEEADRALTELGVRIERKQVYDPGVDEGTVTKLDPPAGKALPLVVTVTVAGPASSVYLAELQSIEGGCSAQETSIDGQDYAHALICSPYYGGDPQVTTYLLDRRTSSIEGVVGVTDESDAGFGAAVTITGDGKTLWSGTLRYGTGTPFTAKTSGVLRLEIRYRATSEAASGSFALGDARAVGSPEDITALGAE